MSQNWLKYAIVAGALLLSGHGNAQNSSVGITPCGAGLALSATDTTSNTLLSACGTTAVVWNTGTVDVFVNWGTASNTAATTSGWPIPAGSSMSLNTGRAPLYLAVITGSGSATVRVVQGNGSPVISSGGTSTISGSITANQGTSPWIVAGGGTAGTAATGVVTVQGIASMTPILATTTTSASSPELAPVAPATATATKSVLSGCQATSAGITPTTGQQAAVDCDLNNNLLVSSGGAPNLAITQVSVATSDTAVVSARALRRAVTIQQITGTQNVFCNQTTATAGNGVVLPAVVGASFTFNTTSAIRCIAITGAQTVAVAETY